MLQDKMRLYNTLYVIWYITCYDIEYCVQYWQQWYGMCNVTETKTEISVLVHTGVYICVCTYVHT